MSKLVVEFNLHPHDKLIMSTAINELARQLTFLQVRYKAFMPYVLGFGFTFIGPISYGFLIALIFVEGVVIPGLVIAAWIADHEWQPPKIETIEQILAKVLPAKALEMLTSAREFATAIINRAKSNKALNIFRSTLNMSIARLSANNYIMYARAYFQHFVNRIAMLKGNRKPLEAKE